MNPGDDVVVVSAIAKRFGSTVALDSVDVTVRRGELFGVLGPDGAGKTTLFRILTTLMLPDAGEAHVLGLNVARDLWALRRKVGYMPGRFSLYADLTVEENLRFFATAFGTTVEAQYDVIAPIYRQIEPFRDRRAGALSGGMKQKLALSCALVHRPEILVLDEPTTGVDAVSRREFWDLLDGLQADGLTTIVSTPYMDEANRCDRVALMQRGRVLAIDRPAEIVSRYPLPLFAVRGSPRQGVLRTLRAFAHAQSAYPFGETLHYADRRGDLAADVIASELLEFLRAHDHGDAQVDVIAAGIEDCFMHLMGAGPMPAGALRE